MKNLDSVVDKLENIISSNIIKYNLPIIEGNIVRLGKYLIRPSKNSYLIVDTTINKSITKTYSKLAAIAYVKSLLKQSPNSIIFSLDKTIEKNENDIIFYENSILSTNNETRKNAIKSRLELSQEKINYAKKTLDNLILI